MDNIIASKEVLLKSIIDMVIEEWRFKKVFERMLQKFDIGEQSRYRGQFSWFDKKVSEAVDNAGLYIVNVEGQDFDIGMAVTPLNLDDFAAEDKLFVEQMLEPIIMGDNNIIKTGKVILGRVIR